MTEIPIEHKKNDKKKKKLRESKNDYNALETKENYQKPLKPKKWLDYL